MFDMFGDSVATPLPSLELAEPRSPRRRCCRGRGAARRLRLRASVLQRRRDGREAHIGARQRADVRAGRPRGRHRRHGRTIRTLATKAGKQFVSVAIEDLSGSRGSDRLADIYERTREYWKSGNILLMLVRIRERSDRLNVAVQQARSCRRPMARCATSASPSPSGSRAPCAPRQASASRT